MNRKVLLMILDGWGEGKHDYSNAIWAQGTPVIDGLRAKYPFGHLQACGEYVGLPDGQMGNSEVGHMNLGAGRVVYQDLVKINMAVRDHKFLDNAEIKAVYDYVKTSGKKLHLMGLTSHGGVHSSLDHVYEFLRVAKEYGLEQVYVHAFMDGRDTDPHSGKGFLEELEQKMAQTTGKIATVCGRFYAMDRDKRWNRVKEAYDLLVEGKGPAGGLCRLDLIPKGRLIGIGAPTHVFLPEVAKRLGMECVIPQDAAVANAVGAIVAGVNVHVTVSVRPDVEGGFSVHGPGLAAHWDEYEDALDAAQKAAAELAGRRAESMRAEGGEAPQIRLEVMRRQGHNKYGDAVDLGTDVLATASVGGHTGL